MTLRVHIFLSQLTIYGIELAIYGIEAIDFWITRKRDLIPERSTKEFIIHSSKFILKNNNFFYSKLFNQVFGTAMRTKCVPPYVCLTIGYQEVILTKEYKLIKKVFK